MTHYAEDLLETIEQLSNWPDRVKLMQNNWIGKSLGANINFKIIEIVKKHGSDFAYPTTSVFLENQKN